MKEAWKPVREYEALYEVSSFGKVRSLDRKVWNGVGFYLKKGRVLAPWTSAQHLYVSLCDAAPLKHLVHRLVLDAFVGPCPGGQEGCHYDGNPSNNRVSNLRWDTSKNNHADRIRHGNSLRGEKAPSCVLSVDEVLQIRFLCQHTGLYQREIAALYGLDQSTVSNIHTRKNWYWLEELLPTVLRGVEA